MSGPRRGEHATDVFRDHQDPGVFWAQCWCDWTGDDRREQVAAVEDAQDHVEVVDGCVW